MTTTKPAEPSKEAMKCADQGGDYLIGSYISELGFGPFKRKEIARLIDSSFAELRRERDELKATAFHKRVLSEMIRGVFTPLPPGEQEISDSRDDAASAAHHHETHNPAKVQYAEGVRDALAWVIGDGEKPEV